MPKDNPSGIAPRHRETPQELVVQTAPDAGEHHAACGGYLYFSYNGKTSSIKSLELLVGETVVKLR